ncbi:peptidoglycan DD-metalloendopeptidase family protein [Rhodanobacter umsongensis]|uniref:Peptidoglycan DD-metalloendopeptidase family protein n=1 Tax=Rhodanobacter umsongensis TaxID=633153 RepID=A0ABW0JH11_9GAMM
MLPGMDRNLRWLAALGMSLLLAGCGTMRSSVVVEPAAGSVNPRYARADRTAVPARTPIPGGSYVVVKSDTLYSIAFRKGVDFRDLAQWNGIAPPYTIWPGQRLTLSPSGRAVTAQAVHLAAPSKGAAPAAPSRSAPTPATGFEPVPAPSATTASAGSMVTTNPPPTRRPPVSPAVTATTSVVPVAGVPAATPAAAPPPASVIPAAAGASRSVSGVSWRWPADGALVSRFQSGDAIPGIEIGGKPGTPVRAAADGVVVYSGNGLVGYGELVIIKHNESFLSAYGHNRKRLVKEGQRVSAGQQIAEMGSTGATRNELEFQIRKDGNPVDPLGYLPSR